MKRISLKADFVIKGLFAHEKVRKQFLSDVLDIPIGEIGSVRITSPVLRRWLKRQKQGILDIALMLDDNTKIDIEIILLRILIDLTMSHCYINSYYASTEVIHVVVEKMTGKSRFRCVSRMRMCGAGTGIRTCNAVSLYSKIRTRSFVRESII